MKNYTSLFRLTLIAIFCVLIAEFGFRLNGDSRAFCIALTIFFSVFCATLYYVGRLSAGAKDIYLFSRIFLVSVFVKIAIFLILVLVAVSRFGISKDEIIIPSLVIYVLFTSLETYELMLLSKGAR